jgi:hypothetical protein
LGAVFFFFFFLLLLFRRSTRSGPRWSSLFRMSGILRLTASLAS